MGCNQGDEWAVVQAGRVRAGVTCVPLLPPGAAHLLLASAHLWAGGRAAEDAAFSIPGALGKGDRKGERQTTGESEGGHAGEQVRLL